MKTFFCFIFLLFILSACKQDPPPPITVCMLTRYGGAQCVDAQGVRKFKYPSELENYWAASQADMKALLSWCYGTQNIFEEKYLHQNVDKISTMLQNESE